MTAENISKSNKTPLLVVLGALLLLWLLSSWFIADSIAISNTRALIQYESLAVNSQADNIAHNIDINLDHLHGIPALVANSENVLAALSRMEMSPAPSSLTSEQRKKTWSEDERLIAIDSFLGLVKTSLDADVVWVTNAAGDCIASSNVNEPDSFVGTNYADRDYFRMAQAGKPGRQYAMGRKSNIPGLFFSSPITIAGRFAGVAVAKIDLPNLSHWVSQADAFISDKFGIIILSRDKKLEMRSLPNAAIAGLSKSQRLARYKQVDFAPLAINSWEKPPFSALRHFDDEDQPLLIAGRTVKDEGLDIHAYKRLPEVSDFSRKRLVLFLSIAAAGTLVLFILGGRAVYARISRHAELRMAESASLLRAAIEATADGILVIDNDRRITIYNQHFVEMWHVPSQLLATDDDEDLLNFVLDQVEEPQRFLEKVVGLYAHPESTSFDIILFKDQRIFERYSFPQRLGDQAVGRVWSFRDITERKLNEQALRNSRDELEGKVLERTADLQTANAALLAEKAHQEALIKKLEEAQNQLLQSEKLASIGQLAAGVAHEINNPVGFVNSNLGTLQHYMDDLMRLLAAYEQYEGILPDDVRGNLERLKQEVDVAYLRDDTGKLLFESMDGLQRVKRIVQDLKDFAHVGESEKQRANLERGLESTLNVVWNELKYKTEVVKEYGGIPEIDCIPSQLNQVFMNLLMNAAHAIEERGKITIRTGQDEGSVWVEIEDTGKGIAPEHMKRIFEPFFTTKPVGQGTGLGLSLSYGIVQKHGGRIEVKSEVGKGTVFRVVLPKTFAAEDTLPASMTVPASS